MLTESSWPAVSTMVVAASSAWDSECSSLSNLQRRSSCVERKRCLVERTHTHARARTNVVAYLHKLVSRSCVRCHGSRPITARRVGRVQIPDRGKLAPIGVLLCHGNNMSANYTRRHTSQQTFTATHLHSRRSRSTDASELRHGRDSERDHHKDGGDGDADVHQDGCGRRR